MLVIDDDAVWAMRHQSQREIADQLGVSRYQLRDALRPRGWTWKCGFGVVTAPCRACRSAFAVRSDQEDRLCDSCNPSRIVLDGVSPAVALYRQELAKRKHRIGTPEWIEKYRRPGGPEAKVLRSRRVA